MGFASDAAVSIGIGIDFAIHFIARYREELIRHRKRQTALRVTGRGTGQALVASAVGSSVGFAILAFAPMSLFDPYGLLSALMIVFALVATRTVLPSVLMVITKNDVYPSDKGRQKHESLNCGLGGPVPPSGLDYRLIGAEHGSEVKPIV